jgi:hypothetical protein
VTTIQQAFPYEQLLEENRDRGRLAPEYELLDTGIFDDDRRALRRHRRSP